MTMRVPYQDIYFIDTSTDITAAADWSGTGLGASVYNLLPTNKPDLLSGKVVNDVRKATGLSQRRTGDGYEFTMLHEEPSISGLTVELNRQVLGLWMWLLLQSGVSQDADPYEKTGIPYTDSDCEIFCSIGRLLDAGAYSHRIDGAIIKSLTVSGSSGGVLTMSADFIGRDFSDTVDLSGVATTAVAEVPVLFQELATTLDTNAIELDSFELTITNNAERRYYDNPLCTKIVLGNLEVSGNFTMPWTQTNESKNTAMTDFLAGNDMLLVIATTPASTDDVSFSVNARYTGDPTLSPDAVEHMLNIPFIGAYDGTNHAIQIYCEDGITRGIS